MAFDSSGAMRGAGLGSLVGGIFGNAGYQNPYGGATSDMANKFLPELQGYRHSLDPYVHHYESALSGLLNDPSALIDHIMGHYKESPFAQRQTQYAQNAASAAAAQGGYTGTPQEQEAVAQNVGGIASQDENQYLHNALSQYGEGLHGMSGIMRQMPGLFQQEGQTYGSMASLEAARRAAANQHHNNLFSDIGSGLGSIIGGSPLGKAIGSFL